MKIFFSAILLCLSVLFSAAQNQPQKNDTSINIKSLDSIVAYSLLNQNLVKQLQAEQGTYIFSGKKTEVINLATTPADVTNKTGRQVFAKIPGVFVYDMDGAGNQINIAARGLDPHRGWEFNNRKDGIITNSDMYGYPASHYSMPLESIERIEIVRGTGALQYGAQFGGMLNYITKRGDTSRPVSFESINTTGSFGLLSTYNAVGGKTGKLQYYAYIHYKSRNGYRDNEQTDAQAQSVMMQYDINSKLSVKAEWARSKYLYRIPGALTDSMFTANPRQSTRSRNYFSPDIHIPSIVFNWAASVNTKIQLTASSVLGKRNSVLFDKPTNVVDTINLQTLQYNNRQVDIDRFNSYTAELRMLQLYKTGMQTSSLVAGVQLMHNNMRRTQLGKGTNGSDYDLALVDPVWGRDMYFKTKNFAFFAENKFQLSSRLAVNIGARAEIGKTNMAGKIVYYPENQIPVSINHQYPLFGMNVSYKLSGNAELYGGLAQSYRPMLFKDLVPSSLYEKIDPNIKDSKGYNAEMGFRGNYKFLRWDVTLFLLEYKNRFGTLAINDNSGTLYTYRTNTGNSRSTGAEILLQGDWKTGVRSRISAFTSTAFMHARYSSAKVKSGNINIDIKGNRVESAPDVINRTGISWRIMKVKIAALYSYTSKTYADALNTEQPLKTTGAVGMVPSYGLLDFNTAIQLLPQLELRVAINNSFNKKYFTKRPLFYPGPGVWPSDGRNVSITAAVQL